jgi:hypothetical protein
MDVGGLTRTMRDCKHSTHNAVPMSAADVCSAGVVRRSRQAWAVSEATPTWAVDLRELSAEADRQGALDGASLGKPPAARAMAAACTRCTAGTASMSAADVCAAGALRRSRQAGAVSSAPRARCVDLRELSAEADRQGALDGASLGKPPAARARAAACTRCTAGTASMSAADVCAAGALRRSRQAGAVSSAPRARCVDLRELSAEADRQGALDGASLGKPPAARARAAACTRCTAGTASMSAADVCAAGALRRSRQAWAVSSAPRARCVDLRELSAEADRQGALDGASLGKPPAARAMAAACTRCTAGTASMSAADVCAAGALRRSRQAWAVSSAPRARCVDLRELSAEADRQGALDGASLGRPPADRARAAACTRCTAGTASMSAADVCAAGVVRRSRQAWAVSEAPRARCVDLRELTRTASMSAVAVCTAGALRRSRQAGAVSSAPRARCVDLRELSAEADRQGALDGASLGRPPADRARAAACTRCTAGTASMSAADVCAAGVVRRSRQAWAVSEAPRARCVDLRELSAEADSQGALARSVVSWRGLEVSFMDKIQTLGFRQRPLCTKSDPCTVIRNRPWWRCHQLQAPQLQVQPQRPLSGGP